jgi:hypothetical protein
LFLHIFFRPPDKMLSGEIVFIIRAISPKRLGGSVNISPNTKGDAKGIHILNHSQRNSIRYIFFQPPNKMLSGKIVFIIHAISPKRLGGSVNAPPILKDDAKGIHNLNHSLRNSVRNTLHFLSHCPSKSYVEKTPYFFQQALDCRGKT